MAKRELSSTLKNLKFMQRAAQKEVIAKKEEVKEEAAGDFPFPSSIAVKRCVVIAEGDPHPGATRGRMSFLSFNPSIDKLDQEVSDLRQSKSGATTSVGENGTFVRENRSSRDSSDFDSSDGDGNSALKRKQPEVSAQETLYHNKSPENSQRSSPSSSYRSQQKPNKQREKLDWNVLRPPKYPRKTQ